MARPATALWQLAHDLYTHEPLVQERRDGSIVRALAAGSDHPHQDRGRIPGQHDSEGSSGRHRGAKKNGPQSIGKSRGGWSTKIHMVAEGNETRQLAFDLGFVPVVPPKRNRIDAWEYDQAMYKRRNEIERLFRRLKGFRRIFSRFEKLDVMFIGFIHFALIVEAFRSVNTP